MIGLLPLLLRALAVFCARGRGLWLAALLMLVVAASSAWALALPSPPRPVPPLRWPGSGLEDDLGLQTSRPLRRFPFAGTRWVLPTPHGSDTWVLQADGTVASLGAGRVAGGKADGRAGPTVANPGDNHRARRLPHHAFTPDTLRGHWRVHHAVLQVAMSSGVHYTLSLGEDSTTLAGVARRVDALGEGRSPAHQWPARLRRVDAPAAAPALGICCSLWAAKGR